LAVAGRQAGWLLAAQAGSLGSTALATFFDALQGKATPLMQLYLLRHADAETKASTDDERTLSEKGKEQALRVADFCDEHGLKPDALLASPLPRAQQTARPLAEKFDMDVITARWLACGAVPATVLEQLSEMKSLSAVTLVGHEPDLSRLIGHLLGAGKGDVIHVRKASLTAIEVLAFLPGGGRLDFSIPVKLM
jgi:phosphohistidine phosphatase